MHSYRTALRAHIRKLERELSKAIREGRPSDHIGVELGRARTELAYEMADA